MRVSMFAALAAIVLLASPATAQQGPAAPSKAAPTAPKGMAPPSIPPPNMNAPMPRMPAPVLRPSPSRDALGLPPIGESGCSAAEMAGGACGMDAFGRRLPSCPGDPRCPKLDQLPAARN